MGNRTLTKGNIVVEEIKVGDIHYEFEYGMGVKLEVLTLPVLENDSWTWKSKNVRTGEEVLYTVVKGFEHYGPNLYDYEAYTVNCWL